MHLLKNTIQDYAWGSRTALAELLGQSSPAPRPQAELWMGAHPSAPSRVVTDEGERSLLELLQLSPGELLGARVSEAHGAKLPFLLKVLAVDSPLSLQVHPNSAQARCGFDAEEAAGMRGDDPRRNYKDRSHKPELLCALEPFVALCGFRAANDTSMLLGSLGVPGLDERAAELGTRPDAEGLRRLFSSLMAEEPRRRSALVRATVGACDRVCTQGGPFAQACSWAATLGRLYPDDAGVVGSLLLNLVELQPYEAIFLPAGNLHAYLSGTGVEIMASSDNVVRGGLTPKHVDVEELLRILDFDAAPVKPLRAREVPGGEHVYETPASEFRLSRVELPANRPWQGRCEGPEILLCVAGSARVKSASGTELELSRGAAAFLSASTGSYVVSGPATVFRATVGD